MAKKAKPIPVDKYGKHAAGVPKAKVNVSAYVARQQDKRNRGR